MLCWKKRLKFNKKEGDYSTPKGLFNLRKLYFRKDRVGIPKCKINKKIIKKIWLGVMIQNIKNIMKKLKQINKNLKENLYRKDHKYDYIISINHNERKTPGKGSAIFIHLTNNYKPTAGCVALKKKDFEILLKLIDKKTKIKIG